MGMIRIEMTTEIEGGVCLPANFQLLQFLFIE
ncbi:hypothetical protein Geob_2605 [Geotalea daltonii FRC-32]|uniref:Uncharacterized protein n=1 Tax=Geotalea daltonii (strain DSM 22248 / JCM 15807 / FRC-32) TaxID=316067 RepID=B9M0V2_GEODF|nr:hypothetical protein Geob_2605 [Geotalea daltonii FRC-32]